ncbi:MAG: amino acid permease [Novosphingobium sp.]
MRPADSSHLLRILGVAFGIAVVVGGTIGQGILRTPGMVAEGVPHQTLIVALWLIGGVVCAIDAMSTVELASSIRRTGGPYIFVGRAFGPLPGLATGLADWLANVAAAAFVSVVFGEYLHRLGIAGNVPLGLLAATLVLTVGVIQLLGTKVAGRSQELGSAIKASLFCILVAALLLAPRGDSVAIVAAAPAATFLGVIVALRGIFGTYAGWNSASYFCEEVHDPSHSIARATFSALAIITAIYVLVNVALLSVLTPAEMAGSNLVAADAAARVFGPMADPVVTAISLISLVTIANATIMIFPRVAYAIARDAGIPGLSHVADNGTPRLAVLVTVAAAALLALVGVYDLLLAFSATLFTAMGVAVNAAAIAMRLKHPDLERPYAMPLFPLPAIFALTANAALFVMFAVEDPVSAAQAFGLLSVLTALTFTAMRRLTVA